MSVKFIIAPRASSWIVGSPVVLDLRIENHGAAPFETPNPMFASSPQPAYRLKRPGGGEESFTPAKIARVPGTLTTVRIDPGHAWVGEMILTRYSELTDEGEYEIGGEIRWNGAEIAAAPARFAMVAARFSGIAASLSLGQDGTMNRELLFLQRGAKHPEAVASVVTESDAQNAELKPLNYQQRGELPDGAKRIYGPYYNYGTPVDPLRWVVVSGERSIYVGSNMAPKWTEITSDKVIGEVLTPLATRGPVLHVLALLDIAPAAEIAFAAVGKPDAMPPSASLRTIWRLDRRPAAVRSALAPERLDSAFLVAATQAAETGARLKLAEFSPDGALRTQADRFFPGLAPARALAAHWATDGRIHVGFLATALQNRKKVQLAEVVFEKDLGSPAAAKQPAALELSEPLGDARLEYYEQQLGSVSRAAVLHGESGTVFFLDAQGRLEPAEKAIPREAPLALIPGRVFWYAFWLTPSGVGIRSF